MNILVMKFDDVKKSLMPILSNKKYQWVATVLVFIVVLMMSSGIRMSNWDLLTDSTTGEKIPLALDPYYFLRIAETIVETNGNMPNFDEMRIPGFEAGWSTEVMPRTVVAMWKIGSVFGDYTLREVNVFSPVFFYAVGLILFFLLGYALTKSKGAALLSSVFLAFIPSYLYRTMAGFSDHEAIGMVGFFAALVGFVLAMKKLETMKRFCWKIAGFLGLVVGALSIFSILCWGGVAVLLFMILPIAFGIFWVVKTKDKRNVFVRNGLVFYLSWLVSCAVFYVLIGLDVSAFVNRYLLGSNGIFSLAVLGFIVVDWMLMKFGDKFGFYEERFRIWWVLGLLFVLGGVVLGFLGKNVFLLLWEILNKMLNPAWGLDRVSGTVAENAQPYLTTWISTAGKQIFWLFVAGMIFVAWNFSKSIRSNKSRWALFLGSAAMIFGILFSRISADSIMNGAGIFSLSGLVYLGGIALFAWAFFKNYFSNRMNISSTICFLFAWMIVVLIVGRSTTRLFFVIAPFMCLCAGYFIVEIIKILRERDVDEVSRVLVVCVLVVSVLAGGYAVYVSHATISYQAQYTGPSANNQWQGAMEWVRENTSESAIFAHWWDYGYWVQTLGERTTIADGGHAQTIYDGNHKIGRYVLTTPIPETALSFFKTMNVDYLLIDQTDLGKYGAYSLIGGGNDDAGESMDRYSGIPVLKNDPSQTRETSNGTVNVFSGGSYLYEDIVWRKDGREILLPAGKAAVIGIVIRLEDNDLIQPEVVYVYNGVQTRIPARYVYFKDQLIDFESGLDIVIDVIPAISDNKLVTFGAAIYLSQKVSDSLFARLYLLDDAFEQYEDLGLVHAEDDPYVEMLKAQGALDGDFVYYNGFRGPIKIWDVSGVSDDVKVVEEFKDGPNGEYGMLDYLEFVE
jgi:asparagine N-glycosylation enzyme membrane subunit Stt3